MKFLLPIINLSLAAALFFLVTDKMFVNAPLNETPSDITASTGGIRAMLVRQDQLNQAIATAKELSKRVNELNGQYNSFSSADLERLDLLLPDNIDNIQLVIDVNGIAKQNGMTIKNIKISTDADKTDGSRRTLSSSDQRLGTMLLSFNVVGTYDAYRKFLADLASSLRIIDISSTSFNTEDKGVYNYAVELRTYWLK